MKKKTFPPVLAHLVYVHPIHTLQAEVHYQDRPVSLVQREPVELSWLPHQQPTGAPVEVAAELEVGHHQQVLW